MGAGLAPLLTKKTARARWWLAPLVLAVACAPVVGPGPPSGRAPTKAPYTAAPPTPPWEPIGSPAGLTHGQPYQPADIALALQSVPRSFPAELRTPAMTETLASALASGIWTYDGRPYEALFISGSCDDGPKLRCEVLVQGIPAFAKTRDYADIYQWVATPGFLRPSGEPFLGGYPAELDDTMDQLARTLDDEGVLKNLTLVRMGWAPPPLADGFILRYSDGALEGGTTLLVTVDRRAQRIVSITKARS